MKQVHDYSELKLEFFQSDIDEVKSFINHKGIIYDANRTRRTKGRTKEKQERKMKIVDKAIEKQAEKQAKELEIPVETLLRAKKFAIGKIIEMITKTELSMGDIAKGLEKIKTELGEPEHVSANYNLNANKVEGLTDEESEALDVLFSGKSQKSKKSKK